MAITINDQPTNLVRAAYDDFTITASSTLSANYYFKYVFDVYIDTVFKVRVKASPGNNNRGVVNLKSIIKDFIHTDIKGKTSTYATTSNDHAIHQIDEYSENEDNLVRVKILVGEEYATASDGVVNLYDGAGSAGSPSVATSPGTYYTTNAVQQVGVHASTSSTVIEWDYSPYILDGTTKSFLSELDATVSRKLRATDYHTLAFFNGTWGSDTSALGTLEVKEYNDAGVQQGSTWYIDNTAANGGYPYTSSNLHDKGLLYIGVGAANFTNAGVTLQAGTTYYTVQAKTASAGTLKSKLYRFDIIDDDCKGYDTIRLAWLNRLGAWDYYCFTKKSTKSVNVRKKLYRKTVGNWADNPATGYTYSQYERGNSTVGVSALDTFVGNTDFISEAEASLLESLYTSPNVYMIDGDDIIPVVVTDTKYTKQSLANDQLMQYTINIEKAHKLVIQQS